jgi:hypothetical protein
VNRLARGLQKARQMIRPWIALVAAATLGCVGSTTEDAVAPLSNDGAPHAINGRADIMGVYENPSLANGPVARVILLACWMEIRLHDGTVISGNYRAFEHEGLAREVLLEHEVALPIRQRRVDLWRLSWELGPADRDGERSTQTLVVTAVDVPLRPTALGTSTRLTLTQPHSLEPDETWCLGAVEGELGTFDGRTVLAPPLRSLANEELMGVWRAADGAAGAGMLTVREMRIGPCNVSVDFFDGSWTKGNYVAFERDGKGVIDQEVSELGQRDADEGLGWATDPWTTDPSWGAWWAFERPIHQRLLLVMSLSTDNVQWLRRAQVYQVGPGESWCTAASPSTP